MVLAPNYCKKCGHELEVKQVERISRRVCSKCGEITYENPIPVAAAVVLNEKREVLLIKRKYEPEKGKWCLPTGFAELNETIAEATLRELEEETGVKGEISRLLSTTSDHKEHYGDLLIVSFEVKRIGGKEEAKDDADEIRYFSIGKLPDLAFGAHETAVRTCADLHREEWAIQDSFSRLDVAATEEMLSDTLLRLIENHAEEICERWVRTVRTNPSTATYRKTDREKIQSKAMGALSKFCFWLRGDEAKDDIKKFYLEVGRERREQGFALPEVLSALTLLRKEVWIFARDRGALSGVLDLYRNLELSRRVVLFFDKALYYTAIGFGDAGPKKEREARSVCSEDAS